MEFKFGFEVVHVRDLGPVADVLEDLIRLIKGVLRREGLQELGLNIFRDETVEIRNCINVCISSVISYKQSAALLHLLPLPLMKKFKATETLSCWSFLVSSAKSREFWTWRKTSVRSLIVVLLESKVV